MMKSITLTILVLTISFNASGMQSDDPYVFVKDVASATFAKMKQEQTLIQGDQRVLRNIVEQQCVSPTSNMCVWRPYVNHVTTCVTSRACVELSYSQRIRLASSNHQYG